MSDSDIEHKHDSVTKTTATLAVVSVIEAADKRAKELAELLHAPCFPAKQQEVTPRESRHFDFELLVDVSRIQLQPVVYESGPIGIDFTSGRALHRLQQGGARRQPLVKAVGITKKHTQAQIQALHVLDPTSGFLRDAWVLATQGCKVTALERCAWLHWMQADAINQATHLETASFNTDDQKIRDSAARLTTLRTDAIQWLDKVAALDNPDPSLQAVDCIYLDPMYPERKKSAAVKKDMQALHWLVGPDLDSDTLITAAAKAANNLRCRRLVVKRPRQAPSLNTPGGCHAGQAIVSENTRYDVLLVD